MCAINNRGDVVNEIKFLFEWCINGYMALHQCSNSNTAKSYIINFKQYINTHNISLNADYSKRHTQLIQILKYLFQKYPLLYFKNYFTLNIKLIILFAEVLCFAKEMFTNEQVKVLLNMLINIFMKYELSIINERTDENYQLFNHILLLLRKFDVNPFLKTFVEIKTWYYENYQTTIGDLHINDEIKQLVREICAIFELEEKITLESYQTYIKLKSIINISSMEAESKMFMKVLI